MVSENFPGHLSHREGEIGTRLVQPRHVRHPVDPDNQWNLGRVIANHRRGEHPFAVVAQRQHHRARRTHVRPGQRGMFEHITDDIDPWHALLIDNNGDLMRVAQHFHDLAANRPITSHHDGTSTADRCSQPLDLGETGLRANHDQDRARFDAHPGSLGNREASATPLAEHRYAVTFP